MVNSLWPDVVALIGVSRGRGKSGEFMRTDDAKVTKAGSEGIEHPDRVGKVDIHVWDESVKEISDCIRSFGFIVRAFYHETVHVRQVYNPFPTYFNQTAEYELTAYYISSTNANLPPMASEEEVSNAVNALHNFFWNIEHSKRTDAYKANKERIDYFRCILSPQMDKDIREALKF